MRKLLLCMALLSLGGCIALPPQHSANFSDCFYEQSKLAQCVNGSAGGYLKVQLTQPPGGITGNLPPWVGGNGSVGQVLTSRGPTLAPTFQAAGAGGTPGGSTTQIQYNNAGAFGGTAGLTWDGTSLAGTSTTGGSSSSFVSSSASPSIGMRETDGGTDGKNFDFQVNSNVWSIRAVNDANSAAAVAFSFTRSNTSTAISNVSLGNATNNPTYSFLGSGTATFSGPVTMDRLTVVGSSSVANGISLPSANTPTGYSNSVARYQWTSVGLTSLGGGGYVSAGTKFTAAGTGCTVGTTVGGGTAGTFTLAAGPCTAVAITMGGATGATAPNGWSCQAHDRTAPTILIGGEASSTTTTATITIPAGAGTADVISFSCMGY